MIKKILCPIDFSPGSQHAMHVAVRIANERDAELVLAHVWYIPPLAFAGARPFPEPRMFPGETLELMRKDAERGLTNALRDATELGAKRVTTQFLSGAPWLEIVKMLEGNATYDLVVMGTHGRTGLKRLLLGSVAGQVVRHAPCPVLAVRERSENKPFHHVLCPIDFSESSRHALALAGELAAANGSGIMLMHVIEATAGYWIEPPLPDYADSIVKRGTGAIENWAADFLAKVSVPVATRVEIGYPGAAILTALEDDPTFDLVVMGSHGRTGIKRVLLGSVAEKVVRHAPCPVLVARAR